MRHDPGSQRRHYRMSLHVPTTMRSTDAPTLTQAHFDRAKFRVNDKAATRPEWQDGVRVCVGKQRITIMLDTPIIEHVKATADERGYQARINNALRRAVVGEHLQANLRMLIREERGGVSRT